MVHYLIINLYLINHIVPYPYSTKTQPTSSQQRINTVLYACKCLCQPLIQFPGFIANICRYKYYWLGWFLWGNFYCSKWLQIGFNIGFEFVNEGYVNGTRQYVIGLIP